MPAWSDAVSWDNLFPIVFFPLKILVLGVGMFFSIKWHHDQGKKQKEKERLDAMAREALKTQE